MSVYSNHLFKPGTQNNSWSHLYDYVKPAARVLDVGCSSGNFGEALRHLKKCEVVGVDIDENDIALAKKVLNKALVMDINDTSRYKELGSFDVIIFADVIEHLVDPRQTLKNIKPLLKKDGRVIFSIPHMAHSSVRMELLSGKFPYKERGLLDRTHLHFYDREEFESVFHDAGYDFGQVNPVLAKYPDSLLQSKLQLASLSVTKNFKEFLKSTDGDIFQFVGFAVVSNNQYTRVVPKYIMPQDEVYNLAQAVIAENNKLSRLAADLGKQINNLDTQLNERNNKPHRKVIRRIKKMRKEKKR